MKWIHDFDLFLFDFDGLLVNTEHLHYQAYINMMAARGYELDWNFSQFCGVAHLSATALREALYEKFPNLDPNWTALYAEKKKAYYELVCAGKVEMMPGAHELLTALHNANIRRCVATNSFLEQIQLIRSQLPILQTIPHWITRENYEKQKPDPEPYLCAIKNWGHKGDRIIGFEDSIRGIQSLQGTPALPVLICAAHHPLLELATEGVLHYESLRDIPPNTLA